MYGSHDTEAHKQVRYCSCELVYARAPWVRCQLTGGPALTVQLHSPCTVHNCLMSVSCLCRLLPLLLEWLQAYDSETRTGAARALYHLTRHTWPRSPAHAPALWHHLSALYVREAADTSPSSTSAHSAHSTATGSVGPSQTTEAARWALETCKMLGCVGGEALWQAVEQTRTQLGSMCDTGGHTSDGPVTAAAIAGMRPELHRALETLIAAVEAAQG